MANDGYTQSFTVRWSDLDANGHMTNTAYLDTCVDVRFGYFASRGLSAGEISRMRIGPVVRRDEADYHRELRFRERFTVDIALAGMSDDASHFGIQNRFFREDGTLVARVVSFGGWLDLVERRLVAPPAAIRDSLLALPQADGFRSLKSSVKGERGAV